MFFSFGFPFVFLQRYFHDFCLNFECFMRFPNVFTYDFAIETCINYNFRNLKISYVFFLWFSIRILQNRVSHLQNCFYACFHVFSPKQKYSVMRLLIFNYSVLLSSTPVLGTLLNSAKGPSVLRVRRGPDTPENSFERPTFAAVAERKKARFAF